VDEYVAEADVSLDDIPMPEEEDEAAKAVNEQIQKAFHEELARGHKGGARGAGAEGKREYKFAWNEDIQVCDI